MAVEAQSMAVVPNRFGLHTLVEGPGRQVHPKTRQKVVVLGFTPSRQPSRAHQSQNVLEQLDSGPRRVGERLRQMAVAKGCGKRLPASKAAASKAAASKAAASKTAASQAAGWIPIALHYLSSSY